MSLPDPPVISEFIRNPNGQTGTVFVEGDDPACYIFIFALAANGDDLSLNMVGNVLGEYQQANLSFLESQWESSLIIFPIAMNAEGSAIGQASLGPLPSVGASAALPSIIPRHASEIVRR